MKTVLITGSSSGFGFSLAHAFVRGGYTVILHGRDEQRLHAVRDEILKKEKVECPIVVAEMRDSSGLDKMKFALRTYVVDFLINNAALNLELDRGDVAGDLRDIDAIISTNTSSVIALCFAAFEHFKTLGAGMIMNVNSVAGLRGSSHEAVYAASKFGLRGFSESVKEDWLKQGIRMIDVYPGAIATGMSSRRSDFEDLINPGELAEYLVGLCQTKSFFVKELNIRRTIDLHS